MSQTQEVTQSQETHRIYFNGIIVESEKIIVEKKAGSVLSYGSINGAMMYAQEKIDSGEWQDYVVPDAVSLKVIYK